jgi:hypothetical protein
MEEQRKKIILKLFLFKFRASTTIICFFMLLGRRTFPIVHKKVDVGTGISTLMSYENIYHGAKHDTPFPFPKKKKKHIRQLCF